MVIYLWIHLITSLIGIFLLGYSTKGSEDTAETVAIKFWTIILLGPLLLTLFSGYSLAMFVKQHKQ